MTLSSPGHMKNRSCPSASPCWPIEMLCTGQCYPQLAEWRPLVDLQSIQWVLMPSTWTVPLIITLKLRHGALDIQGWYHCFLQVAFTLLKNEVHSGLHFVQIVEHLKSCAHLSLVLCTKRKKQLKSHYPDCTPLNTWGRLYLWFHPRFQHSLCFAFDLIPSQLDDSPICLHHFNATQIDPTRQIICKKTATTSWCIQIWGVGRTVMKWENHQVHWDSVPLLWSLVTLPSAGCADVWSGTWYE